MIKDIDHAAEKYDVLTNWVVNDGTAVKVTSCAPYN